MWVSKKISIQIFGEVVKLTLYNLLAEVTPYGIVVEISVTCVIKVNLCAFHRLVRGWCIHS